jgi:hypothetical protein
MRSGRIAVVVLFGLVLCACASAPKGATAVAPKPTAPREAAASATTTTTAAEESSDDDAEEEAKPEAAAPSTPSPCARNMVIVEQDGKRFCIDKYEAALVEVGADGAEKPYAHWLPVDGHSVRAVSEPGLYPQGYISEVQAADACIASGKRLCSYPEWKTACMGPKKTTFPYGEARRSGVCNDAGKSAVVAVFGAKAVANSPVSPLIAAANDPARRSGGKLKSKHDKGDKSSKSSAATATAKPSKDGKKKSGTKKKDKSSKAIAAKPAARPASPSRMPAGVDFNVWTQLNDPRLGQVEGALTKTGENPDCANGFGVVDMVGNIHEWVATDPSTAHGTFAGGYYLDTSLNGDGCGYKTQAHAHDYHDYSTGFRCCADPKE